MPAKQARHSKIKEVVTAKVVSSQEELLDILKNEGFDTTQATLSRDLHEMGIVRVPHGSSFKYVLHHEDNSEAIRQIIGMEIISVDNNESTVVVKTMPGRAQGVAIYLDKLHNTHIIGTVAGDDAIIIIPDRHAHTEILVQKIKEIMH
ncbi:MAG: arginine repressor [Calditrichaceae bacterium]|nr:arginine repressor [Calditrichaceae bacterium]MBN2708707.1 arginine repressor [Calditrichaceae bacterium]RQV92819.1 MAG: arginine repressor [Calditrichota bacterium]